MEHDLAKWLSGEMNESELAAFRNSPEYNDYERIARLSRGFKTQSFDEDAMLARVTSLPKKEKEPKVIPFYRSTIFRAAAIFIIGLGLFLTFRPESDTIEKAASGKMASIVLPDASQVKLNSGSEITYDKSSWYSHRELTLKGEAYFKVAKGQTFDVNTDLGKVSVVGTQFNVKVREKRFEVECYEGKVKVSANGSETMLTPGMMVIFENGQPKGAPILLETQPAWTKGEIRFVSASLDQVAAELERRFDVKIELKAKSSETVTGTFSGSDINATLQPICQFYKLNAKTQNNVVILSADE